MILGALLQKGSCLVLAAVVDCRPVALGDQEPDLGAAHFQQRVGRDGGAVGEEIDFGWIDAAAHETRNAVEHAGCRIVRRARHLLDQQRPRRHIVQNEVRVGAAHVDAQPIARDGHGRVNGRDAFLPSPLWGGLSDAARHFTSPRLRGEVA